MTKAFRKAPLFSQSKERFNWPVKTLGPADDFLRFLPISSHFSPQSLALQVSRICCPSFLPISPPTKSVSATASNFSSLLPISPSPNLTPIASSRVSPYFSTIFLLSPDCKIRQAIATYFSRLLPIPPGFSRFLPKEIAPPYSCVTAESPRQPDYSVLVSLWYL
jgi:hypothetical protein